MTDIYHKDQQHAAMHSVNHAVIANPHTPGIGLATQLLASGRKWIIAKRLDFRSYALLTISGKLL
jgi:hypothetical protein